MDRIPGNSFNNHFWSDILSSQSILQTLNIVTAEVQPHLRQVSASTQQALVLYRTCDQLFLEDRISLIPTRISLIPTKKLR